MAEIVPAQYQPALPLEKLIIPDGAAGAGDRMELDVLIVGAGPAGLACAIELARLAKADGAELNIGVLEKAEALGEHSLSGAVVNPRAFRELFPDVKDEDFPFRQTVTRESVYLLTQRGKYLPLDLRKVATSVSTRGMFFDEANDVERLFFSDWSPKVFDDVPFQLVAEQVEVVVDAPHVGVVVLAELKDAHAHRMRSL